MMQGKVVVITGGAKGIGRHAAHTLAKAGAKIVLADADLERTHHVGRAFKENERRNPNKTTKTKRQVCHSRVGGFKGERTSAGIKSN